MNKLLILLILPLLLFVGCSRKEYYTKEEWAIEITKDELRDEDEEVVLAECREITSDDEKFKGYDLFIVETYSEGDDTIIKRTWFIILDFKYSTDGGATWADGIDYYDLDLLHTEIWDDMEY